MYSAWAMYVATTTTTSKFIKYTPRMSNIIVAPCSKMSAESHFEDLSQHPKFNAVLGQIE